MDDLQGRFRRLDRVTTPDLWHEAVQRAAELEAAPRRVFNPGLAVIAAALLLTALAGTLAVGAWLNRPAPTRESVTYENGMIIASGGCGGLVRIDPTSFATRVIIEEDPGCEDYASAWPAWSQDGTRLAYARQATADTPPPAFAWVYDAVADTTRQVGNCPAASCERLDISPDGSLLATTACCDDGNHSLVVIGVDSAQTHRVDLPPGAPHDLAFSPDGSQIALSLFGGQSGVYLVDVSAIADGVAGSPVLMHGIVEASDLAWSPDGAWIAMTQAGGLGDADLEDRTPLNQQLTMSGRGIVVVRTDGSGGRVLASGPHDHGPTFPTWSPDSSSVAYMTWRREGSSGKTLQLWTVGVDGGEPRLFHVSDCCITDWAPPAWSPDGEWIAFGVEVADDAARSGVVLIRPDGSDLRYSSGRSLEPVWQPVPND